MEERDFERLLSDSDNSYQSNGIHRNQPTIDHSTNQNHQKNSNSIKMKPSSQKNPAKYSINQTGLGHSKREAGRLSEDLIDEATKSNENNSSQKIFFMSGPKELLNEPVNKQVKSLLNEKEVEWDKLINEHDEAWKNFIEEVEEEMCLEAQQEEAAGISSIELATSYRRNNLGQTPALENRTLNVRSIQEETEDRGYEVTPDIQYPSPQKKTTEHVYGSRKTSLPEISKQQSEETSPLKATTKTTLLPPVKLVKVPSNRENNGENGGDSPSYSLAVARTRRGTGATEREASVEYHSNNVHVSYNQRSRSLTQFEMKQLEKIYVKLYGGELPKQQNAPQGSPFKRNFDPFLSIERIKILFPNALGSPPKPRRKTTGKLEPLNHRSASMSKLSANNANRVSPLRPQKIFSESSTDRSPVIVKKQSKHEPTTSPELRTTARRPSSRGTREESDIMRVRKLNVPERNEAIAQRNISKLISHSKSIHDNLNSSVQHSNIFVWQRPKYSFYRPPQHWNISSSTSSVVDPPEYELPISDTSIEIKKPKALKTMELLRQQMLTQQKMLMDTVLTMKMVKQPPLIIPQPVETEEERKQKELQQKQQQDQLKERLKKELQDPLREKLQEQLHEPLREQLREPLKEQLQEELHDILEIELRRKLQEELHKQMEKQLQEQMQRQLEEQEQLREQMENQLREQTKKQQQEKEQLQRQLEEQEQMTKKQQEELQEKMQKQFQDELQEKLLDQRIQHLEELELLQKQLQQQMQEKLQKQKEDQDELRGQLRDQLQEQLQRRLDEQKALLKSRKKFNRIRRYLWTIAYPKLLDNYAETEVMQRVEEIRGALASIKDQTEDLLVQHFFPEIQDNMMKWRDDKRLIYEAVMKPDVTEKEIADTRFSIESEIVAFIREIFDRTTTAVEADGSSPDYNPYAEPMPEAFLIYLEVFVNVFREPEDVHPNLHENMKFISSIIYQGIMDLYYEQLEHLYTEGIEKSIRLVTPADPIFAPGSDTSLTDEEDVINGLYTKQEIRDRMKTDIDWGETIHSLVERTWASTAAEIKAWKLDPTKKKAVELAKQDPLLKNAVFRAILRPV